MKNDSKTELLTPMSIENTNRKSLPRRKAKNSSVMSRRMPPRVDAMIDDFLVDAWSKYASFQ